MNGTWHSCPECKSPNLVDSRYQGDVHVRCGCGKVYIVHNIIEVKNVKETEETKAEKE
jgi:hypothetical protein